ncbi:unnamed protein product [Anisakis simplex]|uniref:Uncharacterized protein n=1 Tax=Anisakis simplex TaxID=6269 RepID=A0A3P6P555_ANISI|nr:unnamed protein product [Anisakis simplex]
MTQSGKSSSSSANPGVTRIEREPQLNHGLDLKPGSSRKLVFPPTHQLNTNYHQPKIMAQKIAEPDN